MSEPTEAQLREELAQLNRDIPTLADKLAALKDRRDSLAALFPHKDTPAPRIVQKSFAIG